MQMKFKKTFSLIEIMVVLALLGTVMGLLVPQGWSLIKNYQKEAEKEKLILFFKEAELQALLKQKEIVFLLEKKGSASILNVFFKEDEFIIKSIILHYLTPIEDESFEILFHPLFGYNRKKEIGFSDGKKGFITIRL